MLVTKQSPTDSYLHFIKPLNELDFAALQRECPQAGASILSHEKIIELQLRWRSFSVYNRRSLSEGFLERTIRPSAPFSPIFGGFFSQTSGATFAAFHPSRKQCSASLWPLRSSSAALGTDEASASREEFARFCTKSIGWFGIQLS
jgi:hypothetical protein